MRSDKRETRDEKRECGNVNCDQIIVNVFVIKVNEVMRFLQSLRSEHPTIGGCEGIHRIFSLVSRKRPMAKVGGDAVRHIPTFATTIAKKDR